MSKRKTLPLLLAALLLTGIFAVDQAMTQEAATAEGDAAAQNQPIETPSVDQPQAESVLKYIPSDCMGFYVVPNVKNTLAAIENYAKAIGVGEELEGIAPKGLLATISQGLDISKGYNPNGGLAVVILDFEKAGIDLSKMGQPGFVGPQEPPFVLLLAGQSIESVFPTKTVKNDDGTTSVQLIDSPSQVEKLGDYLAISPYPNALKLMKDAKSVTETLSPEKLKLINDSLFAEHFNMASVATTMDQLKQGLKGQQEQMQAQGYGGNSELPMVIGMTGMAAETLQQMTDITAGVRMGEMGTIMESLVDYKPDSLYGKQIAAMKPATGKLLSRVPDLPYVVAMGTVAAGPQDIETINQCVDLMELMLKTLQLELPADLKQQTIQLSEAFSKQLKSMQMVSGGATGPGAYGSAVLMNVENAETTRDLLAQETGLLTTLVAKTLAQKEEDLAGLEFKYNKNAETVGTMQVDVIEVLHPEMQELREGEKEDLLKIQGEDKLVFRVAPVDLATVVLTFGGGQDVLTKAIDAAQKGGTIEDAAPVQQALQQLPAERLALMLVSPQNLLTAARAEAQQLGEEMPAYVQEFQVTSQVPMAMGVSAKGSAARVVWYVPNAIVKDSVTFGKKTAEYQQQQYQKMMEEMRKEQEAAESAQPPANDF